MRAYFIADFYRYSDTIYKSQQLETISIAEPQQNRQHERKTPNAVNTKREGEKEKELKRGR